MPWCRWLCHLFDCPWRRRAHTPWESEYRGLGWGPERAQAEVSRKCYPSAGPPESPFSLLPSSLCLLCSPVSKYIFCHQSLSWNSSSDVLPPLAKPLSPHPRPYSVNHGSGLDFHPLSSLRCILKANMRNDHVKTSQHLLAKLLVKIPYSKSFSVPHGRESHNKSFPEFSARNKKYILKIDSHYNNILTYSYGNFPELTRCIQEWARLLLFATKKGCLYFGFEKDVILNYSIMYYFFLSLFWKLY